MLHRIGDGYRTWDDSDDRYSVDSRDTLNTVAPASQYARNLGWLAPEFLVNKISSSQVDVYAFGAVCLEVCPLSQSFVQILLTFVLSVFHRRAAV